MVLVDFSSLPLDSFLSLLEETIELVSVESYSLC